MRIIPEQVENVWAGDVVRFDPPVGDIRRPGWKWYIPGSLLLIVGLLVLFTAAVDGDADMTSYLVSLSCAGMMLGLLVAEVVAAANGRLAARIDARRPARTLAGLASSCWLAPLIRGWSGQRYDARRWIERTGPGGPRVVVRELQPVSIRPDSDVNEECSIRGGIERSRVRRIVMYAVFGLGAYLLIRVAMTGPKDVTVLLIGGLVMAMLARRLGLGAGDLSLASAVPDVVRFCGLRRTEEFSRENAVLLLEPRGSSAQIDAYLVRADGRQRCLEFTGGLADPMLQRLISRWSWRGGAGAHAGTEVCADDQLNLGQPASAMPPQ